LNEWIEAASTNLGDGGIGEDREQDGRTRNTLSFKGTGLKTLNLDHVHYDDDDEIGKYVTGSGRGLI
jgi:hypothetical protein